MKQKCLEFQSVVHSVILIIFSTSISSILSSSSSSSSDIWYLDGTTSSYLQFNSWKHFFTLNQNTNDNHNHNNVDNNENSVINVDNNVEDELDNHYLGINDNNNNDNQEDNFFHHNHHQSNPKPTVNYNQNAIIEQASIGFEFRYQLDQSTLSRPFGCLLLYTDDETGIGGRFLEIKLLSDTNIRVRIDDNSMVRTENIIELRQEINFTDGRWHHIELIRHFQPLLDKSTKLHHHYHHSLDNYLNSHHYPQHQLNQSTEFSDSLANLLMNNGNSNNNIETITLIVDSERIHKNIQLSSTVPGYALYRNECLHKNRSVFIGGIPDEYRGQNLAHFALPTVAYELHFRGAIRNVFFSYKTLANSFDNKDAVDNRQLQLPVNYYGLLHQPMESKDDLECDPLHDRCKHGGYCYTTKNGVHCDCSVTDFEGTYCQNDKRIYEATFHGQLGEYLGYNYLDLPNAWSLVSTTESFELSFRTKNANGLLLLTSDEYEDYLAITIRDAGLTLTMKLGSNVHEKSIQPSRIRFDDNQWHTIMVWRRIRELSPSTYFCHFSISVDGIYTEYGSTSSPIAYLISKVFYVGGIAHNNGGMDNSNPITASSNFVGCLRKIILTADNMRLDLLEILQNSEYNNIGKNKNSLEKLIPGELAKDFDTNFNDGLIRFYGNRSRMATMHCEVADVSDPITFTTSESYLKLNGWNSPNEGSLSVKIRTNEANGVIVYGDGNPTDKNVTRDYFALELLDGHVYLLINLGSTPVKVKASNKRVDDGHWHMITVRRLERAGQVVVDDTVNDFVSPGQAIHLDLNNALFLGGIPQFIGHKQTFVPPELWSASMGHGYIGCIKDLYLNNKIIDLVANTKLQDSGSIRPYCHSLSSQCINSPCQNGGQCLEGWNRYYCDCTNTAYTGSICTKNAATVGFNGEQFITITLPEEMQTEAESLYVRFRTKKSNGLLLATTNEQQQNYYMRLSLESGSIRLDFNYGDTNLERIALAGQKLNDDLWHTVHLERRGPNIEIGIDTTTKQVIELTGQHFTLHFNAISIGHLHKSQQRKHFTGFVGQMRHFIFNGQPYFEKIRDGQLPNGSVQMTAKLGKKDRVLHNAVTFKSKYTFVGLPQLKAYSGLNVYFQFKTREPNGLLLYNGGGQKHDFIALELVNGNLHYLFDLGDGPRRLQSNSRTLLNDNRWHTVTLGRPSLHQHTLLIDDSLITTSTSINERNLHLDLDGLLYFGGVRDDMWHSLSKAIKSRIGFEGCIASLDLAGETFNLIGKDVLIPSTLVESGCLAPITRCSSTACANRGICVQLWNSYTCDCDLTTFSGSTCADGNESTAYQFGPNPGLISFTFDENNRPDTRNDLLILGFLTNNKNGALVRIDSATTADYFQMELIDGNVIAIYNLGTENIDIGDFNVKVNDGKYHIVRFTRSGQNSTLQIDNQNVITRSPTGKQLNIFNSHAFIQIGGHKNALRGIIEKPFIGIIAGLVFNGHKLLDIAAEDDPRIKTEGDIELMISIGNQQSVLTPPSFSDNLNNQMLAEPKSSYSGGDDLIYSNAGSGCFDVNEDEECVHIANEGSGDDLITPVYVSVNRFRPTPSTSSNLNGDVWRKPCQNEDDDDCNEGSGDQPSSINNSNNNNRQYNYSNFNYYTTTPRSWTTWIPPTVPPIIIPPFSNQPARYNPPWNSYNTPPTYHHNFNNPYGGSIQPGMYPMRPKTTAPSWTKPVYSVSGPTRPIINSPINPQGPPEIYDVPLNIPDIVNQTTAPEDEQIPKEILSRANSDRTVIIISAIAIMLILVVVIGPIVLFYKVRYSASQAAYKIETFGPKMSATMPSHGSSYLPYNPVVRATSVSGITDHTGLMMAPGMNSLRRPNMSRPGTPTNELMGSMKKKDPHEWYV